MSKYAGADWLQGTLKNSYNRSYRDRPLSPFGVKVADVLGQVEKGIYHIQREIFNPSTLSQWFEGDLIRLSFYNGTSLSSFDSSRLTALFLCASAAGVEVDACGASPRYYTIKFRSTKSDLKPYLSGTKSYEPKVFNSVVSMCSWYCDKVLCESDWDKSKKRWGYIHGRYPGKIAYDLLYELLRNAHESCIRIQLHGFSSKSLKIWFHQRDREGDIYNRHPTWEKAIETHKCLWEPLLEEAIA